MFRETAIETSNSVEFVLAIEDPDSIADGARGLVGKRGDTAMRERFFSFKYKIRKYDQKNMPVYVKFRSAYSFFHTFLCQNSSFFHNRRKPYFLKVRNQSMF